MSRKKRHLEIVKENEIKHPDKRMLSEIKDDDRGQVKRILKGGGGKTNHAFPTPEKAYLFAMACRPAALERLGVPPPAVKILAKDIEAILDRHNIRMEQRKDPKEPWRNGTYIYKNNELAYFISSVLAHKPSEIFIPGRSLDGFGVITNVMRP